MTEVALKLLEFKDINIDQIDYQGKTALMCAH
jgi:hypothetical protein